MPFKTIPQSDRTYALINFDENGRERTDDPDGGVFSGVIAEHVRRTQPTHVLLFSHGWKGDVPTAVDQYNRWIAALWKLDGDRVALGPAFKPLFIGLHWPSLPWGDESLATLAPSFSTDAGDSVAPMLAAAVAHFGGGVEAQRALETIFHAFEHNPAARVLPDEVIAAYQRLAEAIGFSAGAGADAAPEREGVPLDPQAAVRAERMASAGQSFGLAASVRNGVLAGLRQASFWLMKKRGRTIGEQGMHTFVSRLQEVSNASFHLMGHSFGCIVASSVLGGPGGTGSLRRPIESLYLVQGALSHWSYADKIPDGDKPGYFRHVLSRGAVSGPIVTTQSEHDTAVGQALPAAVGLVNEFDFGAAKELPKFGGIGSWGIQGTTIAEQGEMLKADAAYAFAPKRIYNLEASRFIPDHNGIDGPEVAHALWQSVLASPPRS